MFSLLRILHAKKSNMALLRKMSGIFWSFWSNRDDDQSTEIPEDEATPPNAAVEDEEQPEEDVLTFSLEEPETYIFNEALQNYKRTLLDNGVSYNFFDRELRFVFKHASHIPDDIKAILSELRQNITRINLEISTDKVQFIKNTDTMNHVMSKLVGNSRFLLSHDGEKSCYIIVGETKKVAEQCFRRIQLAVKEETFKKKKGNLRFFEKNIKMAENELRKQHNHRILFVRNYMPQMLKIVCTDDIFQSVKKKIEEYLKGKIQKRILKIKPAEKSYIETYKQEDLQALQESWSLEVTFLPENANGHEMQIEGLDMSVETLETYIQKIQTELVTRMVPFLKPEDWKHLKHEEQLCTYLANEAKCICTIVHTNILHAAENNNEWPLWQRRVSICDNQTMPGCCKKYGSIYRIRLLHMNHTSSKDKNPVVKIDTPSLPGCFFNTIPLVVSYTDGSLDTSDFQKSVFATLKNISEEAGKCFWISLKRHFKVSVKHLTNAFLTAVERYFEKEAESSINHIILQTAGASLDVMKKEVVSLSKAQIGEDEPVPTLVMTGPLPMVYEIDVIQHFEAFSMKEKTDDSKKGIKRAQAAVPGSKGQSQKRRKLQDYEYDQPGTSIDERFSTHAPTIEARARPLYNRRRSSDITKAEGGEFAKSESGLCSVATSEILIKHCTESIGYIFCGLSNNEYIQGTCFRVGTNKIITAYHVLEKKLEELNNSNSDTRAIADRDIYVMFNFKHEVERPRLPKLQVKWPPLAYIPNIDIIILELKQDPASLPNKLTFQINYRPSNIHFMGHHNRDALMFDLNCRIVQQWEVEEAQKYARQYSTTFSDGFSDVDSRNYLLFHSSASAGASGCPGFMVEKESAYIIGVLVKGYPSFYPNLSDLEKASYPPRYRIEAAVTPRAIFDNLEELNQNNLRDEIFQ